MLSRRAFLAGSGAACGGAAGLAAPRAADAAASLILEPADLQLVPPRRSTDAVRLAETSPALRLAHGTPGTLAVRNALDAPVSLRWDGLRGWGARDAAATMQLAGIAPGQSRSVPFGPPDSGTTLLRAVPSAAHLTARGLQGVVVVDEAAGPAVDRDLAVLLADRLFAADGSPRFGSTPPVDATVSVITVNGRPAPWDLDVLPRGRLRLRLVNGSVRRVMLVGCEGARPMIVAIDGQPSEMFAPARNTLPIGPGARYDLLLDMPDAPGAEVRLSLKASETLGGGLEPERLLVRLRAAGAPAPPRAPSTPLPPNPALPTQIALEAARRADLVIAGTPGTAATMPQGWTVNGRSGEAAAPVLTVRHGEAITLGLINTTPMLVPVRIAGHPVRLLHAKDDGWDPYWRDTLLLPPGSRNHVAFVADRPGRWAIDSGYDDLTLAGLCCCFEVKPG